MAKVTRSQLHRASPSHAPPRIISDTAITTAGMACPLDAADRLQLTVRDLVGIACLPFMEANVNVRRPNATGPMLTKEIACA